MFINDSFSIGGTARGRPSLWKPIRLGDKVSVDSNATVLPVEICAAVIGAGAVVTSDITESGIYGGNPARRIRSLP